MRHLLRRAMCFFVAMTKGEVLGEKLNPISERRRGEDVTLVCEINLPSHDSFSSFFPVSFCCAQVGEEMNGMIMVRSADNRQGVCPAKYLQDV